MKKKILFVNGHLNVGGVEKALVDILNNFDYDKYDVDLILFEELGDYYPELTKKVNVRLIDLTKTYGNFFQCIKKSLKQKDFFTILIKVVLTLSSKINQKFLWLAKPMFKLDYYDCTIAFRPGFCAEFVAHCVKSKKKICWWHHGECNYDNETKQRMIQTFNLMDKVVSVSKGCEIMIKGYFGNLENKTIVIPNMIDIDRIHEKANEFNPYLNDNNKWKFISVGRLSPEKNMINCVNVAKYLVNNDFNDFTWYIVGDGIEYKNIQKEIVENGFDKKIILLGSKSNPYPYIKNADVLIHPSLVESYCITVLEGMALNKPCIVTESIGPKEFINNYENGILTSSNSNDMSNEIIKLIENKDLFTNIRTNSIYTINNYMPKGIINKIENELF